MCCAKQGQTGFGGQTARSENKKTRFSKHSGKITTQKANAPPTAKNRPNGAFIANYTFYFYVVIGGKLLYNIVVGILLALIVKQILQRYSA